VEPDDGLRPRLPGCANCYALTLAPRLQKMQMAGRERLPTDPYMRDGDPKTSGVGFGLLMHESRLDQPLRWRKPRRIFVNSMSDLFHPEVTDDFLDRVFAVMALAPQHTFQVLTKRPERMREYMTTGYGRIADTIFRMRRERGDRGGVLMPNVPLGQEWWPLPNVWLGTSVENARWRTRIDELREIPAAVRFLSCEPLLGPLTESYRGHDRRMQGRNVGLDLTGIGWVIVGGESGGGARPMDEQWVRDIVAAARRQGAAPFVKQMGAVWSVEHLGHGGHAGNPAEWPEDLRIREMPA
jgi:protein gp37